MNENGKQYPKDDRTDPSGFLKRARQHQSDFRLNYLELPYDTYGNYLTKCDGEKGKNCNYSGSLFLTNDEECRRVVNILL